MPTSTCCGAETDYPETPLLTQPKPFIRMNDWTEQYENYE